MAHINKVRSLLTAAKAEIRLIRGEIDLNEAQAMLMGCVAVIVDKKREAAKRPKLALIKNKMD